MGMQFAAYPLSMDGGPVKGLGEGMPLAGCGSDWLRSAWLRLAQALKELCERLVETSTAEPAIPAPTCSLGVCLNK